MNFYKVVTKTLGVFDRIFFRVEVVGKNNIPKEGACILACNHKSNWDPVLIAGLLNEREIHGVAKKELFKNNIVSKFFKKLNIIPVDRDNPDIRTVKSILKVLKDENMLGIFPEGTRNKNLESCGEAKPGLGMFALKGNAVVVPITIVGDYKIFSKMTIYIDKPVDCSNYVVGKPTSEDYQNVSNKIMDIIKNNYFKLRK